MSNHVKWNIYVVLLILACGFSYELRTQPPPTGPTWQFKFGGKVTEFNDKKQKDMALEGANVTLLRGGQQVQTVTTNNSGRFKFTLDPNSEYTITITKAGYITKRFTISTYNVPAERGEFPFAEFDIEVGIFKLFPGLDYSCLDKPIAKVSFNPAPDVDDFDYDKVYTASIQKCVDDLKRLEAEARAKQKLYDAAIEKADKAFNSSKWQEAKDAYNEALGYLPNEQYPKDQIVKCDEKMGADAANRKKYDDAIAEGNRLFDAKDWTGAKAQYQVASGIKPAEQYPKDRITLCDQNIAAAGKKAAYDAAIAAADAKYKTSDWAGAKTKYQEASAMMPAEVYPKDQILKCDAEIAKAANKAKYDAAIADADAKFKASDWAGAKTKYQEASTLIASEQYPKDQIVKCDAEIAKSANKAKYDAIITEADAKFKTSDWAGAKAKYQEASGILASEQYPKDQIVKCDAEIGRAANKAKYDAAIKDADAKFSSKDWAGAKTKYQEASTLIATEQYPKDQVVKCDEEIAKAANKAKYDAAIADADAKFKASDWTGAKTKYQEASNLIATEQYPKDQVVKCDAEIAKAASKAKYDAAIADADAKFKAADFSAAKVKYQDASAMMPSEQYPKDQIVKCDAEIAKLGLQKQFDAAIKDADTKFNAKDFTGAKTKYQEASNLKSAEQYPKDQIVKCDEEIAKKDLQEKYDAAIKDADAKFNLKDWTGAKAKYQEASGLKAAEQYPKDQIAKCDAEIAKEGTRKQYDGLIADADAKFKAADFSGAKSVYQQASDLMTAEKYPKDQIVKCDAEIAKQGTQKLYDAAIADADAKFKASDWAGAKAKYQEASALKTAEVYPKDQIKLCDSNIAADKKNKDYTSFIAKGDSSFKVKDWSGAKSFYQQASALKSAEVYPKDQIKLCDAEIAKMGKDKQYNELIVKADEKFKASDWVGAKTLYQQASAVKAEEQYPKDQVVKCDTELANKSLNDKYDAAIKDADAKFNASNWLAAKTKYQEASGLKPAEQYPKDQITKCDENIAKDGVDKTYNAAITAADAKFKLSDWAAAKAKYQEASGIKPSEQYPKDQITKCDENIRAGADKKYNDAIADADKKFDGGDFSGAKTKYQEASGMKPAEQYPKDRIKACDENIAKQGVDKTYKLAIDAADAKFKASDWAGAKAKYQEASGLKPAEKYPKDQIVICDQNINNAANLEANYSKAIVTADSAFKIEDYETARSKYEYAVTLKPTQAYPKAQIAEIDKRLSAINADHAKEVKYKAAIKSADSLFELKQFTTAKAKYQSASTMKPGEQYPKDRMALCDTEIANAKFEAAKQKKYDELIKKADAKFNAGAWAEAKNIYKQAVDEKPLELYPKQRIIECDKKLNPTVKIDTARTPEQIKEDYRNEIARSYPQGLTTVEEKDGGTTTVKKIVVIGEHGYIYTKKSYSWGTYYFKDGVQISEGTFNYETSPNYIQEQLSNVPK